jgi:MFS family permease
MDLIAVAAIVSQIITVYTPVLCLSRFLMGLYCGICSGVVPSYIVSLSPSFTSGIIGSFNQISIALGMAFAYYMGQLVDSNIFSSTKTSVVVLVGFPLICLSVHFIVIFLFPFDTIERHISKRENITVRKYLKMVYGKNWRAFEL